MKKFLFTLASLIAFGFAANAGAPELGFSTNLVDLTPGGDPVEVKVLLTKDAGEVVAGGQLQFVLRDAAGNITEDVVVVRQNLGTPRVPNYQYFRPGVIMDDMGVPVASSNPYPGKFRILLANTSTNIVMMGDELEYYGGQGIEPVLCTFQLQANESWDGEYVTVNLECNPKSMEEQGEDEYPNKWSIPGGSQVVADGAMEPIEVDNTEFTPAGPTALTGTVTIGEAEGYQVPITVDVNGTYTLEVTVAKDGGDPVVVEVVDGKITLGANPEYGTYVINATATGTGDYEGTVVATPKTITIAQQKLDDPEIDFEVGETGVTINVTGATRYEVWVDGENQGEINFVEEAWTEQEVVVKAWNEADLYLPGYAEKNTTVGIKDNYKLQGNLTIGAVEEDGRIYVAYDGQEEIANIVVTINESRETQTINGNAGYVQLAEKNVMYDVTATANAAAEHYDALVAGPVQRIWLESEYTTPDPVVSYNEDTYTITAQPGENSPEGTVVAIYVGGEKVVEGVGTQTYVIPQTADDQYVSYYATATAPADVADVVYPGLSATGYAYVPAEVVPNKDFEGTVTVSVDEDGNVTAVYNPADGETVEPTVVCNPATLTEYGEDIPVAVTVSAPGYNDKTYNETVDYTAPVVTPKTAQPSYNVSTVVGQQGTFVTLSKAEGEDECEILYRYMIDNGTWSEWMSYSDMLTFTQAGYYTMEAKAKADNKDWSDPVSFNFTVNPKPTSIEEIMSAENVANVRFFNVAGQEMQEINGMTIVVVTYTNGQTVSTKVLK